MTDDLPTIDVGGDSFGLGGSDKSQYIDNPFSGDDVVLQSITEQVNETTRGDTEEITEESEDSSPTEESDSSENVQETSEEKTEDIEQDSIEETKVEAKTSYKVKIDGKEISIPDNALFKVKVNGKTEMASLSELVADYNGRVAWAPRFSELGRKEKALEQREFEFNQKESRIVNAFKAAGEALEQKNPLKAVLAIAKAQGLNSKEQVANFLIQSDKSVKDWVSMSPESRQLLLDQIELAQHRELREEQVKAQEELKKGEAWIDETVQLLAQEGLDVQEFLAESKRLLKESPELFTKDENKNRQLVIDNLLVGKQKSEIEAVALSVNPQKFKSLSSENKEALVTKLMKYKQIGEWSSKEELEELMVGLLGKPQQKTQTSLVSQKGVGQTTNPVASKGSLNNNSKPVQAKADDDMLSRIFKEVLSSDI